MDFALEGRSRKVQEWQGRGVVRTISSQASGRGDKRATVWGRPASLAFMLGGGLLIADDSGGALTRSLLVQLHRDAVPQFLKDTATLLTKGFVGMAEASRRSLPEASKALASGDWPEKAAARTEAVELRSRKSQAGSTHARVDLADRAATRLRNKIARHI